jgi:hypothetical protein
MVEAGLGRWLICLVGVGCVSGVWVKMVGVVADSRTHKISRLFHQSGGLSGPHKVRNNLIFNLPPRKFHRKIFPFR